MRSEATEGPPSRPWERVDHRRTGRRRHGLSTVAVLALGVLVLLVLSGFMAKAATYPVLQEEVRIGTTSGIAGAQAVDALRETLTEADVGANVTAAPSAENVTVGASVSGAFPADVASADGVYARYRETTPGPVTVTANPATTLAGCTWTACDSGRLSDNVSASSAAGGDVANYTSFSLSVPASSAIATVELGYEAFDPAGNDHLSMTVSWDGGMSWCPVIVTGGLPPADPNAYAWVNITACGGHAWSPSDFGPNLVTRFTHMVVGGVDTIDLDANAVRVTYQPLAYRLGVEYDWNGLPSGERYALDVAGHVSNDTVSVEVLTPPSAWTPRLTIGVGADQNLSYPLASSEVASGNVSIRFADALGSSPTPSDLWLDLARVVVVQPAYRLDVVQNVTGVAGADPTLTVEGNITAGGANFDVFVWDFSTNAWTLALSAPFTATNDAHSFPLTADDAWNGTVRINIRDRGASSSGPATLTLDFVGVATTDAASPIPWAVIGGGIVTAAILVGFVFWFLVWRRRRSAPKPAPEASPELAKGPAPPAKPKALAIVTVAAEDLEPGHAYLIDEAEPHAALRALEELTRMGHSALVLTRRPFSDLEGLGRLRHTTTLILGDGPGAVFGLVTEANRYVLASAIEAFLRKNPVGVVFLDRLGSLAGPDGMPALLELVRQTAANVSAGQQILLASASPDSREAPAERVLRGPFKVVRVTVPQAPEP